MGLTVEKAEKETFESYKNHDYDSLGWWFHFFLKKNPYLGKILILTHIFQMGWFNHQLVSRIQASWHPGG